MRIYKVGGCVRDELLGIPTKDIDFAVEGTTFDGLREYLEDHGFEIYVETPQFLTIRCRVPDDHLLRELTKDADFTLCRGDGDYSDGRHPDEVVPANIYTDLARRDFTMNAIAVDTECGHIIDPFFGRDHINARIIVAVGDAMERLNEDPLRALRALRFSYTKSMKISPELLDAINTQEVARGIRELPVERVYEELKSIFKQNTLANLEDFMRDTSFVIKDAIFRDGLALEPRVVHLED